MDGDGGRAGNWVMEGRDGHIDWTGIRFYETKAWMFFCIYLCGTITTPSTRTEPPRSLVTGRTRNADRDLPQLSASGGDGQPNMSMSRHCADLACIPSAYTRRSPVPISNLPTYSLSESSSSPSLPSLSPSLPSLSPPSPQTRLRIPLLKFVLCAW